MLTESFRSLTYFNFFLQIQMTMKINKTKFKRLLKDSNATFFMNGVKNGYFWRLHLDNIHVFNQTFSKISKEIKRGPHSATSEMVLVWMDGSMGWMSWVDTWDDVLY